MTLARFVETSGDRPAEYSVDAVAWARLFESRGPGRVEPREAGVMALPPWRYWAQLYAFLAHALAFGESAAASSVPPVVLASRARDIATESRRVFAWNGIEWIDPAHHPGERYLSAFSRQVDVVRGWIGRHV